MLHRSHLRWIILIVSCILIKCFSFFPDNVERYYSTGIYPYISAGQRILFGWVPFSIGDIFYLVVSVSLLYKVARFTKMIIRKQVSGTILGNTFKTVVYYCLWVYVVFNILWGLNYNRLPMAQQLGLESGRYSTDNLSRVVKALIEKLNNFDTTERTSRAALQKKKILFNEAVSNFRAVVPRYPLLTYNYTSVKPSLFSYLGNYMGFTGYYNPFSGEAQANTTVPLFVQPFTTCHEIGHQVGYAKENEANFAGFLAGRISANASFRYSVYFDMYSYAIRELYHRDSTKVMALKGQLKPGVLADIKAIRAFYLNYENPLEPIIRKVYGHYLRANEQPQGMRSYNEVVAMLIAYYLKNGHI